MLIPALIVIENVALAVFDAESVTVTVNDGVPDVVGVPLSRPAPERFRPPGNVDPPLTVQVYPAPDPPVAASVCEYAEPT
jgi:hypothetical protein